MEDSDAVGQEGDLRRHCRELEDLDLDCRLDRDLLLVDDLDWLHWRLGRGWSEVALARLAGVIGEGVRGKDADGE
ncbi:hypothetical protein NDU88_001035 [Pleurodeles waltl]|uniref:Uncharacterized protein n=1 Tax=Pleurodeles waltl TaxID=8319 RepID=A0AAV7RBG5_PLEWA|nr:hypothetical protein NDU88_001035 [Pleurodeles waltl]